MTRVFSCLCVVLAVGACSNAPPPAATVSSDSGDDFAAADGSGGADEGVTPDAGVTVLDAATDSAAGSADESAGSDATSAAESKPTAGTCLQDKDCPSSGAVCSVGVCANGGVCKYFAAANWVACDDGNACTGGDHCGGGDCLAGNAKDCGDGNPCTADACTGSSGACSHSPTSGAACDDGEACTVEDKCQNGVCAGSVNICPCIQTSDCAKQDDGNACNGTLYCDKSLFPHVCKVNPATVVVCPALDLGACVTNSCQPASGACQKTDLATGSACDDGKPCTQGDNCAAGVCTSGKDICSCKSDLDCVSEDDGDLCNGVLFCNKATGKCQFNPSSVVTCPTVEDTSCRKNLCQAKTGDCALTDVNEGKACLDGNVCTVGEVCEKGQCKGGADVCKCKADSDCLNQDDGDQCNGLMFCNKANGKCEVNPASVVVCKTVDDTVCKKTLCQPKSGQCVTTEVNEGKACDDSNACTVGEVCTTGQCKGGADTCKCGKDEDCASEEDGNVCNGKLFCNKTVGKCQLNPATVITCPSAEDTACVKSQCNPKSGACKLAPVVDGLGCDADGSACTKDDACLAGSCVAGKKACECAKDNDCVGLEDGNLCNGTLYCQLAADITASKCALNPASPVYCPSGKDTVCSKNQCDPTSGQCSMTSVKDGSACDDGSLCTTKEACLSGICTALATLECDDASVCTNDSCKPAAGCILVPNIAGCDLDGTACTMDTCKAGVCLAGTATNCDDNNPCTDDLCNDQTGACLHKAKLDGAACSDGAACTVQDVCAQGKCAGVPAPTGTPCGYQKVCNGIECNTPVPKGFTAIPAGAVMVGKNPKFQAFGQIKAGYRKLWTDGLFIQTFEATVADYQACVKAAKCAIPPSKDADGHVCSWAKADANLPVNCVTQSEASGYCAAMFGGRTPTVVEYHRAGRGGCDKYPVDCGAVSPNFPWGNAFEGCSSGPNDSYNCSDPWPVGAMPGLASPYGVHDLVSNVSEWVHGAAPIGAETYTTVVGLPVNYVWPDGQPAVAPGSVANSPYWSVSAFESYASGTIVSRSLGFRCAITIACDPGAAGACEDGDPCTADTCKIGAGCIHVAKPGVCDIDDNPCTSEVCDKGDCKFQADVQCNDSNACTADVCDVIAKGCVFASLDTGTCTDGQSCTVNDKCQAGACKGVAAADASACDDGDLCTATDTCQKGVCKGNTAVTCTAPQVCQGGGCAKPLAGFRYVPGGSFVLGCSAAKESDCTKDEQPVHEVILSPYYIHTTEVVKADFMACVQASKCPGNGGANCSFEPDSPNAEVMPATCVSRDVADQYCAWKYTGGRLPTEAEWEAAARGPCPTSNKSECAKQLRRFPWGDDLPVAGRAAVKPWVPAIGPVGQYPAGVSPFGVLDMAGNVREFVRDAFGPNYYATLAAGQPSKDPMFPMNQGMPFHRGGGIDSPFPGLRAYTRAYFGSTQGWSDIGFRCVIPADKVQ